MHIMMAHAHMPTRIRIVHAHCIVYEHAFILHNSAYSHTRVKTTDTEYMYLAFLNINTYIEAAMPFLTIIPKCKEKDLY
jgi:hypothetical protein